MMSLSTCRLLMRLTRKRTTVQCMKSMSNTTNATNTDTVNNADKGQNLTQTKKTDTRIPTGPSLEHFIANGAGTRVPNVKVDTAAESVPYLTKESLMGNGRKIYFDVYGCQMNTNDTEIAWSVLHQHDYVRTMDIMEADVVLVMTCAIRESAEQKIWNKIKYLTTVKKKRGYMRMKIGILGCMAERLKTKIIEQEKAVDVVCGPDAYKDLPRLLATTFTGQTAVNVLLSLDETYADVMPVRLNEESKTAYVSIMRGCDNMCSYCIVPFTRGRERSRPIDSIVQEVQYLSDQGVREVVLLGQNVNSYRDTSESKIYGIPDVKNPTQTRDGFKTVYKTKYGGRRFGELLDRVSQVDPEMRVRFTAAHPKDFPDEVLYLIKERENICNQLHLPCQSGSTSVLQAMRRGYSRETYLELVQHVRNIIPDVSLTSDIISGFCGETEQDHIDTIELMKMVQYSMVYCFPYSMRQKTSAYHKLVDDVPTDVKARRTAEVKSVFLTEAEKLNQTQIGQYHLVLVEKENSRSQIVGKNDGGITVALPDIELSHHGALKRPGPGDYVLAKIHGASAKALLGQPLQYSSIRDFTMDCQHWSDEHIEQLNSQ